ncbi:hypothetical protein D5086_018651 [Populus alba]|uniref:Uncharacterized protein n=1 Tax=Populus alba TaxID=43335 RepID=A0ACC4BRJ8_POPAL
MVADQNSMSDQALGLSSLSGPVVKSNSKLESSSSHQPCLIDGMLSKLVTQVAFCYDTDTSICGKIAMYLQNKHAATRSQYPAHIDQVFRVSREGENERNNALILETWLSYYMQKNDVDKLPPGKLRSDARFLQSQSNYCSTKGVGGTASNLSDAKTLDDGAVVPLGKPEEKQGSESD